jgi:hypothetical protein
MLGDPVDIIVVDRWQALSEAVNKNTEKTEFPPEFTEMEKVCCCS